MFLADEECRYKLQTGGTDNHLILWDLPPLKLTGSKVESICNLAGITINSKSHHPSPSLHANTSIAENAVSGHANAQAPGGIRLGISVLTFRSLLAKDMEAVTKVRSSPRPLFSAFSFARPVLARARCTVSPLRRPAFSRSLEASRQQALPPAFAALFLLSLGGQMLDLAQKHVQWRAIYDISIRRNCFTNMLVSLCATTTLHFEDE